MDRILTGRTQITSRSLLQNNGQNPYWQNPNNQQIPPQNNGQNPYWQNPNNQQIPPQNNGPESLLAEPKQPADPPPQHNGQPPYWQDQPQRPRREKTHSQRCP